MSEEKPDAMRLRILKQFAALDIPKLIQQPGGEPAEVSTMRALFRDGLLEGEITPDHTGFGIMFIYFTGISAEAQQLIADSAPVARAAKTTKRIGTAAWKIVLGIILLLGGLWAAIDHWPKIRELLGVSPPPSSAAPAQSIQGQQPQAAPVAQPSPSASTPTPPKQNP